MVVQDYVHGLDVMYQTKDAIVLGKLVGGLQTLQGVRQFAIQTQGGLIYFGNVGAVHTCPRQERPG